MLLPEGRRTFRTGGGDFFELTDALGAGAELVASKHSLLVLLGAAWVFPEYFTAVRALQFAGGHFCCLIHDLVPIKLPSMCDKGTAEVFKFFIRRVVFYADAIMCVSEWTKNDLIDYARDVGVTLPPVTVVHNGTTIPHRAATECQPLAEDKEEFVLFVSTIEGRKNHELAFRTWSKLRDALGSRTPRLLLIGRIGWRVEGLIERLYETQFLDGLIEIRSDVSDEELDAFYRNCLFTIYPSRYEGWGLPVAESLALGKVCVASTATSIPEVARSCSVLIDPDDEDGFYEVVLRLVKDRDYLRSLERNIKQNYKPYSWAEVSEAILRSVSASINAASRFPMNARLGQEWAFRRLEYMSSNVMHGEEVGRYYERFSLPALLPQPLRLDNYMWSEMCTAGRGWFPREDWGRWSESNCGAQFHFTLPADASTMACFQVRIPSFSPGDRIALEDPRGKQCLFEMSGDTRLLEFNLAPYTDNGLVRFSIKYVPAADVNSEGERARGVGIVSAVLYQEDDLATDRQLQAARSAERTRAQQPALSTATAEQNEPLGRSLGRMEALFASRERIFEGFDGEYYLKEYKDVARQGFDPLDHFIRYGWKEGRRPAPNLSTLEFFAANRAAMRRLANFETESVLARSFHRLKERANTRGYVP